MLLSLLVLLPTPARAEACQPGGTDLVAMLGDLEQAWEAGQQGDGSQPPPPPPIRPTLVAAAPASAPASEPAADDMAWFRAVERQEGSTRSHMSFLDRGLQGSRWADDVVAITSRLASRPRGSTYRSDDAPMPATGALPDQVDGLLWLHEDVTHASLAVMTWSPSGAVHARWYGRADREQEQYWSATKHLQALTAATKVPGADLGELRLRDRDGSSSTSVQELLQDIVSYDAGVGRSNGGAKTLSAFTGPLEREGLVEAWTGGDVTFRGGYGFGPIYPEPELASADGELLAPAFPGAWSAGPNQLTAYDLTRVMAMAAWNRQLEPGQQLDRLSQASVDSVLEAMGEDSARYVDAALERAGLSERVSEVVVVSKLGHGVRSATGLSETTYTGALQFTDTETGLRHAVAFTFRGVHADPVELDARLAAETTGLVRRLVAGQL